MPHEILHESEGLTIRRNEKNRFTVATLFYYADPAKRAPAWAQTVKAGMTESKWAKEYLIDYTAQFGERVFPEISEKRGMIVMPADNYSFDDHRHFWGGLDYGMRNPTSFHVYTIDDGVIYAIWELYKPCESIPDYADEMRACPYWNKIKYIAADPTMWSGRTHNAEGGKASQRDLFIKYGVHNLLKGDNNETAWLGKMREHWRQDDPTFKILDNCPNMVKEFERAIFADYSNEKLREMANFKEAIVDHDNHAMDDCKYFMNSNPTEPRSQFKPRDMKRMWYA